MRIAAEQHDLAGDFQAGQRIGVCRNRVASLPLQDVRPIDPGRFHAHQDFMLAGCRHRDGLRLEYFRTTFAGQHDTRH